MLILINPWCNNHGNVQYRMDLVPGSDGDYECKQDVEIDASGVNCDATIMVPCGNKVSLDIDNPDTMHPVVDVEVDKDAAVHDNSPLTVTVEVDILEVKPIR